MFDRHILLASKRAIQWKQKQLVIWLVIKSLIKLHRIHHRVINSEIDKQTDEKYTYIQGKSRKLLISNIIII